MTKKPTPKTKKVYDYEEMKKHIEETFNVYIDDYAGKYHLPGNKKAPDWVLEWCIKYHGIKDMDDLCNIQKEDKTRYSKLFNEYRDNHQKNEPPYQNFWHFILDDVCGEINSGETKSLSFKYLKDNDAKEQWQKDILDMFIKEFG